MKNNKQIGDQIIWDQVRVQVGAQVEDQVWFQIRNQVEKQIWRSNIEQIWKQVGDKVEVQTRTLYWSNF